MNTLIGIFVLAVAFVGVWSVGAAALVVGTIWLALYLVAIVVHYVVLAVKRRSGTGDQRSL